MLPVQRSGNEEQGRSACGPIQARLDVIVLASLSCGCFCRGKHVETRG